jgi:hypothetical protein
VCVKKVLPTWSVRRESTGKFRAAVGCPFRHNPRGQTDEQASATTQMNWRTNWCREPRADAVEPMTQPLKTLSQSLQSAECLCAASEIKYNAPLLASRQLAAQRASAGSWKSNSPLSSRLPAGRHGRLRSDRSCRSFCKLILKRMRQSPNCHQRIR